MLSCGSQATGDVAWITLLLEGLVEVGLAAS
jgi:hypothetical protein